MTAYEYDNLPDELSCVDALDPDLMQDVEAIIRMAKEKGYVIAEEAKIAYVYDRKGYLTTDDFTGPRNASYGCADDDLIVQITVRISNPTYITPAITLANIIKERKLEAARAQLAMEIEALQATKSAAEKKLHEKIDQLSKMNVQEG